MMLRSLLFVTFIVSSLLTRGNEFVWYNGKQAISYTNPQTDAPVVKVALHLFTDDMRQVTGLLPQESSAEKATIRIVQLNPSDRKQAKELRALGVPLNDLTSKRDGFYIAIIGKSPKQQLLIVGSDARGTAYGILELSRLAGVSPWIWWGDVVPEKKDRLTVSDQYRTFQYPSVAYRGVFINDEDWSLQPWSSKHFEPSEKKGLIGARTYKEIFKLLLRLRANTIWPAMHESTVAFYQVPGAKEAADSCGIVIGTSHCEPLMRNNAGEWDVKKQGRFNYITNRDSVKAYWKERLCEVKDYENIYTIGMRGVHDGSMEGVKTMQEKTEGLQQVINDQRELLAKYVRPDVTQIPQKFVPYKEVLEILENGLQVPEDVTLMWCDDNYGYLTRLSNQEQQKRSGGAGVYYHLSYWGRPHDHLWLSTTQPGLIYNEMKLAYDHQARREWIANVHDPKLAAYNLELFLDMAWNINSVSASTLTDHYGKWLCREYGNEAGKKLLPAMLEFSHLCGIRRPEFMGWSQVELDKKKYSRGLSPAGDTEFSLTEFGGELDRYLDRYRTIKQTVTEAEKLIPSNRKDAFFAHIKYPVFGAAAMSQKWLEAQRARSIAAGLTDSTQWKNNKELMEACTQSMNAYNEILELTRFYNNELSNGKWKYLMCHNPRNLPVFNAPQLPLTPTDQEPKTIAGPQKQMEIVNTNAAADSCITLNACQYTRSTEGVTATQMLGHSMKAISLPKNGTLTFEFDCAWEGEAILRTAVIPTQPNDKGDIRFSISIDNEKPQVCSFREGFRSESWKRNVMRGQAIRNTQHAVKKGKHTLTIKALDDHVIIDQWMLDFKPERKFYVLGFF